VRTIGYFSETWSFAFSSEKTIYFAVNVELRFQMVIEAIAEKGILLNFDHPDQNRYPNQKFLVVDLDGYAILRPVRLPTEGLGS